MPCLRKPSALLALALLALSCASAAAGAKRESQLRRELNGYQLPRPLAAVWPEALRVLAERGVQLAGLETRDLGGGRWVVESSADGEHLRYRVQGTDLGRGTSLVRYVAIQGKAEGPSEEEARAIDLELALVQRVDPAAAARMLATIAP